MVYTCKPEAPGSNTGRDISYPEFLRGLPQSLQTNSGMVLRFGNVHFLQTPSLPAILPPLLVYQDIYRQRTSTDIP